MTLDVTILDQEIFVITNESSVVTATTVDPSPSNKAIQFQDEGLNLGTRGTVNTVNFTGAGVTASRSGDLVTVNVTSSGGGSPAVLVEGGAERKISAMTALTAGNVATDDLFTIVDISDTTDAASGTNKKLLASEAQTLFESMVFATGTSKDRYHCGSPTAAGPGNTGAATINSLRAYPIWIPKKVTVNSIMMNCTVGSTGNIVFGLYSDDGTGYPNALKVTSGQVAISGTGAKIVAVSPTVDLTPGLYWLCWLTDTANQFTAYIASSFLPIFGGRSVDLIHQGACWAAALTYTATLPSSYPAGASIQLSTTPAVGIRFA